MQRVFPKLAAMLLTTLLVLTFSMQPARAATAHDPILFVHGWNGDTSTWTTMVSRFQADGWASNELYNWTYDSSISNATVANEIKSRVTAILAATGAKKVDIISHSMGALSSRYYLKNLGGTAYVDSWVSLGGPNHGTSIASLCFSTACKEMRPSSSFLNTLNASDETPGSVRYATWWSTCDVVVVPSSTSVPLSGATNTNAGCLGHSELHDNAGVYAQVKTWITQ